jgi:hypothetical protein
VLQLTFPEAWRHWLTRWQQLVSILLISMLACCLTACGKADFPSRQIIEQAIARQVEQVQQPLSQQLKLPPPTLQDIRISHLQISDRDTRVINGEKGYHIRGQYDLTLKQSGYSTSQAGNPFDLYLQPRQEGKVMHWQLAQKQDEADYWILETLNSKS